jgi:ABC-type transport system substrate-binding protein
VVQIKKDAPGIGLYQWDMAAVGVSIFFGFKVGDKAPFKDARLRQAFSMSLDRDLYLDTWANVSRFKADGLEVQTAWNSAARPADYKGWYLDPQSKDFGENGKFYVQNIAEAKKLMSAAGYTGQTLDSNEAAGTNYGLTYAPQIETIHGMAAEAGFKFNRLQFQAPAPWNADYRDSRGFMDGIAFRLTPVPAEPGDGLYALYNKNGSLNYGFDPDGKGLASKDGPFVGDPTADDLTQKMRTEFDNNKRITYAKDLQRYLGKMQYFHHALGSATGFNVAWPAVRNFSVFNGLAWGYLWKNYWIDDTQAPLKKA